MIFISVDLPAPFSPISACTLPGWSATSTFSSASTPGKRLPIPFISSAGPALLSAALPTSSACMMSAGMGLAPDEVEIGGKDDDDARHDHLQVLVPAQDDDAIVDYLEHKDAKKRSEQRASSAGQARPPENDGRNHGEFEAAPSCWLTGVHQRGKHPGHHESEEFQLFRAQARQPDGLFVGTHRVKVATERGKAQYDIGDREDHRR